MSESIVIAIAATDTLLEVLIVLSLMAAYTALMIAAVAVHHLRSHCDECTGYVPDSELEISPFILGIDPMKQGIWSPSEWRDVVPFGTWPLMGTD